MCRRQDEWNPDEQTPAGVEGWCVWDGPKVGWRGGAVNPPTVPIEASNSTRPIVRFIGPDGVGGECLAELRLDARTPGEWELWLIGVDDDGRDTGYSESLAWCRWPDSDLTSAAELLIKIHREAFQRNRTDTELEATRSVREYVPGSTEWLTTHDEDEE